MRSVDILHLTFHSPLLQGGSYNRLVAIQVSQLPEFRHAVLFYESGPRYAVGEELLAGGAPGPLRLRDRFALRLPTPVLSRIPQGTGHRPTLAYKWSARALLERARPRVIVCYDNYKLGPYLRRSLRWPARLVLSQHGLSYFLPARQAEAIYSLNSYDVVWYLSMASYRADSRAMSMFEPAVAVIPNFVDTQRFRPPTDGEKHAVRRDYNLPADALVVLVLGRLQPKKGVHLALGSWAAVSKEVPNAILWIVGDGSSEYRNYLHHLVSAYGVADTVRFHGSVPADRACECYAAADLFLFPTVAAEGMSMALLEAMASGLPSIVSAHASATESYTPGSIVPIESPHLSGAFEAPLASLLKEKGRREALGATARRTVLERYSTELGLARLREFYSSQLRLA